MQQKTAIVALILTAASCLATGCHVDEKQHGDNKDVNIATPFGGMQVKTKDDGTIDGIGLPVYPGATPIRKGSGKSDDGDSSGADVNMSFGSFQLRVKAVNYRSEDNPEKIFDFYKKALGRYGNVIQCRNDHPVGTPTRTNEGLTCEDNGRHNSDDNDSSNQDRNAKEDASPFDGTTKIQLKAGSRKHQHIVGIRPDKGGARFGLISLDLPTDFTFSGKPDKPSKPDRDDKQ